MCDCITDPKFTASFNAIQSQVSITTQEAISIKAQMENIKRLKEENKRKEKYGIRLGINKIVIVNPKNSVIKTTKAGNITIHTTSKKKQTLYKAIELSANKLALDYKIISPDSLKQEDIDIYNTLFILNDSKDEMIKHGENSYALSLNKYFFLQKQSEKYDARYFLWLDITSTKNNRTVFNYILFDVVSDKMAYNKLLTVKSRPTTSLLQSNIYDVFYQFKGKPE